MLQRRAEGARFEANRQAYLPNLKRERVSGIGDEAWFFDNQRPAEAGVYGRAGAHVFVVSPSVLFGETPASMRPVAVAPGQTTAATLR